MHKDQYTSPKEPVFSTPWQLTDLWGLNMGAPLSLMRLKSDPSPWLDDIMNRPASLTARQTVSLGLVAMVTVVGRH